MKMGAVVLAAGESRRMGRPKQLLPWGEHTVLETVIAAALAVPVAEVAVVLGAGADSVRAGTRCEDERVRWVVNDGFLAGMLTSVQAGVAALSGDCDGFLLFLGDQPLVGPDVTLRLASAYGRGSILLPVHDGRRGHPPLYCLSYREELLSLGPELGLRELNRRHPEAVREVAVSSPSIHIDLDTPEDYQRYRPR